MAYDEALAERIRKLTPKSDARSERKMFGGLCFMVGGNMFAGVVRDELMVRVGADGFDEALARPHARPMDFTGRPMKGMVFVGAKGIAADKDLKAWVKRAFDFAAKLPPKR